MTFSRTTDRVRWAPRGSVAALPHDRRPARQASAEFLELAGQRVNILVTGPDCTIAPLLQASAERLQPVTWCSRGTLVLPRGDDGTLLIHDVGALSREQQERLFDWLTDRSCRTQIISISTDPLFPQVQAGTFMADLFYRLNVIFLDLT